MVPEKVEQMSTKIPIVRCVLFSLFTFIKIMARMVQIVWFSFLRIMAKWAFTAIFLVMIGVCLWFHRWLAMNGSSVSFNARSHFFLTVQIFGHKFVFNSSTNEIFEQHLVRRIQHSMLSNKHTQAHTSTHKHTQALTSTHNHSQAHTSTHKHTQAHTITHKHIQTHTSTHKHTQSHISTYKHIQAHTITRKHIQTHKSFYKNSQAHTSTHKHTQAHTITHKHSQAHTITDNHSQAHTNTHKHTQAHESTHNPWPCLGWDGLKMRWVMFLSHLVPCFVCVCVCVQCSGCIQCCEVFGFVWMC